MSQYDNRCQSQQRLQQKHSTTQSNNNHNIYYPIQQQQDNVQYVQSQIVSDNNSIMMSNINDSYKVNNNYNNNKRMNAFQVSAQQYQRYGGQQQSQQYGNSNLLPQQSNVVKRPSINNNNNKQSLQSFQQRPYSSSNRTNKLHVVSESNSNIINKSNNNLLNNNINNINNNINGNNSLLSQHHHTSSSSSLNKRPQSINRAGIRVVSNNSRNSSIQKKSQTSSIEKKNNNNIILGGGNNNVLTSLTSMCGINNNNCKTRSPFVQAQQNNQMTVVPNLGSMETLQSQFVMNSRQIMSDRVFNNVNNFNNPDSNRQKNNTNSSQITNIQQSNNNSHLTNKGNNNNIDNNNRFEQQPTQKLYKHLREMIQNQLIATKKLYEKKCIDQMQSTNLLYQTQIQTLQKVLAENQTLIEHQQKKIQKLQDKCVKNIQKLNSYGERLQSIHKYIQATNKFTIQRVNETQLKFTLLLEQLNRLNITQTSQNIYSNKLQYLKTIFTTLITQTVMKYHTIQIQIKQQIKNMFKKYQYFEQKIYEMDLMKHLGKENQIQNYKLIEKIQTMRQTMSFIDKRNCMKMELSNVLLGKQQSTNNNNVLENNTNELKNIEQLNELKKMLYKLEAQGQFWQRNQQQTFKTINKLQVDKYRLNNKINQLTQQLDRKKLEMQRLRQQNYRLKQLQQKIGQIKQQKNNYKQQSGQKHNQYKLSQEKQQHHTHTLSSEKQKYYQQFSSEKKSQYQTQQQQNVISHQQHVRQIQRLHEIMDQYQCKIQQLHGAIQQLQQQNSKLQQQQLNRKLSQQQQLNQQSKPQIKTDQSQLNQQSKQQIKTDQSTTIIINKLNIIIQQQQHKLEQTINTIEQKQQQLQQALSTIQQFNRQKQQLNHALQMTQHIFDQQITKFKSTIQKLQQENQLLLNQLNDIKEGNINVIGELSKSPSSLSSQLQSMNSKNINSKKIIISKSPKKQMLCETVTMGWFKKKMQQKEQKDNKDIYENKYNNNNNNNNNNKISQQKIKIRQVLSPEHNINNSSRYSSYSYINTDRSEYHQRHISNQRDSPLQQRLSASKQDEFFYPINVKQQLIQNVSSKRKIEFGQQKLQQKQQSIEKYDKTINLVKHSQSLPSGNNGMENHKINNKNNNNNINININNNIKLNNLSQALLQSQYNLPVQCILDQQGRLQLYQTSKYIVDSNYNTFKLTSLQLKLAQQKGLICLLDDQNYQLYREQQLQNSHQQGERYIF